MEKRKVIVDKKFEQILKEEAQGFSIDWPLIDINWVLYEELLLSHFSPPLGKKMVKMVVLGFKGEIPVLDVDDWFRSYRFTYCIYYKTVDTETEKMEMLSLGDEGTIKEIAVKLGDIFRDFISKDYETMNIFCTDISCSGRKKLIADAEARVHFTEKAFEQR